MHTLSNGTRRHNLSSCYLGLRVHLIQNRRIKIFLKAAYSQFSNSTTPYIKIWKSMQHILCFCVCHLARIEFYWEWKCRRVRQFDIQLESSKNTEWTAVELLFTLKLSLASFLKSGFDVMCGFWGVVWVAIVRGRLESYSCSPGRVRGGRRVALAVT